MQSLKRLRYVISNWSQAAKCLSNNSKDLHISVANYIHNVSFEGQIISVVHSSFGTMFATVTNGSGQIYSATDEDGHDLPLMTTKEVLVQLEKFGFDIRYEEEPNLSGEQLTFLTNLLDLGYDAITRVVVKYPKTSRNIVIAYNSSATLEFLSYGRQVTKAQMDEAFESSEAVNIAKMDTSLEWDWLTYTCQIQDLLDANSVVHHISERSPVVPEPEDMEVATDPAVPEVPNTDTSTFHIYGAVEIIGDEDGSTDLETGGSVQGGD